MYKYSIQKMKRKIIFGTCNVHNLIYSENTLRPERTALIGMKMTFYNIYIAALSEMRLPGEQLNCKPKGGYTFFWKGKEENATRIHGEGLAIRRTFLCQLPDLPTYLNQWLIKLCFPLNPSHHVRVISAYTPTMTRSEAVKENFY